MTWARAAGLILVALAVPIAFSGFWLLLYGIIWSAPCGPGVPICRSTGLVGPALGFVVVVVGVLHALAGVGTWRAHRWGRRLGGLLALSGLVIAELAVPKALSPMAFNAAARGEMVPVYDNGAILLVLGSVPCGLVLVGLFLSRSLSTRSVSRVLRRRDSRLS